LAGANKCAEDPGIFSKIIKNIKILYFDDGMHPGALRTIRSTYQGVEKSLFRTLDTLFKRTVDHPLLFDPTSATIA